ncbi:sulfatase family protein [Gimesia fumaroli]|uniref:Choline-sulfatase n=1 Tax=Gimesia fumaroli TaxID=2527976 RepID=A0A518IK80_9PLAN|nr:sulfatase-like hydrolase/transferase [Gimesia fumaroli]QDV53445.1 Choline-sulfatase [Gimesia fumaroli]
MKIHPYAFCSLLMLVFIPFSSVTLCKAAERPNLVSIVTDDQGRWAMGLYGNKQIQTPHMDQIGREGAVFMNAFVATPVCSPSRATFLSGRYPTELKITDYISPDEAKSGLGLATTTWPQVLQKNGYQTALIGKWHLGEQNRFHPRQMGFDHFMGFLSGGTRPMDPTLEINGETKKRKGPLPDLLVDDAIQFLQQSKDKPFALCLHFRAPHTPYGPVPEQDAAHYQGMDIDVPITPGVIPEQIKKSNQDYYASISSVDRNIGRLLKELDRLQLSDNTLVIFTSDHGYNNGRHGISTKGNGHWLAGGVTGPKRPNMWDTSIRVPLVMRWPKVIEPGTQFDEMVSNVDMFKFVLGALKIPETENLALHGIDYSPLLFGKPVKSRTALFGQYDLHNNGLAYMRMIRTPQFKFVKHYRAKRMDELYDLEADPGETKNLIRRRTNAKWQKTADSLEQQLIDWQKSIHDPILEPAYQ